MNTFVQGHPWLARQAALLALALPSLTAPVLSQTLDVFNPSGATSSVNWIALRNDGTILLGNGGLLAVNADGSPKFSVPPIGQYTAVAVQEDGKILLGGCSFVLRENWDQTIDLISVSACVQSLAVQSDGKIIVAGSFTRQDGQTDYLERLNSDGTLDGSFVAGANGPIWAIAIQIDGKLVVGGTFTSLGGQARTNIARLEPDGSLDTGFSPDANGTVSALAILSDGSILVGGQFTSLLGQTRNYVGKLNPDGTLNSTFNPAANGAISCFAAQADGQVAVSGAFTMLGGQPRNYIGRLNADGSTDLKYNPNANGSVYAVALQPDGKLLAGGLFTTIAGQARTNIARLLSTGTVTQNLLYTSSTITWQQTGPTPDLSRAWFDIWTNGTGCVRLIGTHTPGAWQVGGLHLPTNATIRARGYVAGSGTGSSWLEESMVGPPAICTQPVSQFVYGGATVTFDIVAAGQSALSYQWSKNGASLADTGNVSGSRTMTLTLTNVSGADAGPYQVRVTNSLGSVTSIMAWLTVGGDPGINRQPASSTNKAGEAFQFSVSAMGHVPLSFQWLKDGANLSDNTNVSGSQTPAVYLAVIGGADSGAYQVIVSNSSATITSDVARLTVMDPAIFVQPHGLTNNAGTSASFSIDARGTAPLAFQWLKNGLILQDVGNVSGSQSQILQLGNVSGADAAAYSVVISNAWGSVTSAVATLSVVDPYIKSNPASKFAQRGQTVSFSVTAAGAQPLSYAWRKNGAVVPGANATSLTLTNVQSADDGGYDVVVSDAFGSVTSLVATLTVNLALPDPLGLGPIFGAVHALAIQPDGGILGGGSFSLSPGPTLTNMIRLSAGGALDTNFNPRINSGVNSIAVQTDGRIIVGGAFSRISGQTHSYLGRLNNDGTADTNFNPVATASVNSLALQRDGKILVGGGFTGLNSQSRKYIGRLNSDGSLDSAFNPAADAVVSVVAIQTDDKILLGGSFTNLAGQVRRALGRLNTDGTLDLAFNPLISGGSGVKALAVQPDGKILIGGSFDAVGGQARTNLGRLNSDGTIDSTFSSGSGVQPVSLALQTDGRVLTGGFGVSRFNADGITDPTVALGYPYMNDVFALALQADGKIVVGSLNPVYPPAQGTNNALSRFVNTDPVSESLAFDNTSIAWLRSGTSPELWRAIFEFSTNALSWVSLGEASRSSGGWGLSGLSLPPGALIRARGFVVAGSWFVERVAGSAIFTAQPVSRTNNAATTATFSANAAGGAPLSYQWLKDAAPLSVGANISGVRTTTLTLSNVFGADAGAYSIVASNAYGSVTSLVATLTVIDPLILTQPANQSTNVGQTAVLRVSVIGTLPLSYQWRKDGTPVSSATNQTLMLTNAQATSVGAYDVIVANSFGSVTSAVATLTVNLAFLDTFNPNVPPTPTAVYAFAVQPDGKILVGGSFTSLAGTPVGHLARLYPDGTADPNFPTNSSALYVYCLALQPDGKILVGGIDRNYAEFLWRLNSNGSADSTFVPATNSTIYCLAPLHDGSIVVGGSFYSWQGQARANLARLNPDGTLDTNFNYGAHGGSVSYVTSLAAQPDGGLLVGGLFTNLAGQACTNLGRLNPDGTLDSGFNVGAWGSVTGGPAPLVYSLALQSDGRILVGGSFGSVAQQARINIARLNPDGTVDLAFNPGAGGSAYSEVFCLAPQADGKILVAGSFSTLGGQPRGNIGRINPDGSVDLLFGPPADSVVYALGVQSDGAILVGGGFYTLGRTSRYGIGRLLNTEPANQNLSFDGSAITWLRGGTSPEAWRATFESSTNGVDWTGLGDGQRAAGGWRLGGLALPPVRNFRARGFVSGGEYNGSAWFAESVAGVPIILEQPLARSNLATTVAVFRVAAEGSTPLTYQWQKAGLPLADGAGISGSSSATLTLTNVLGGDAGAYSVIISNASGSVTSMIAGLLVADPFITSQPVSVATNAGQSAAFSVLAIGATPLTYQWRHQSTNLAGATNSSLALPSVQGTDAGNYDVRVASRFGAVTSSTASLAVNLAMADMLNPAPDSAVAAIALQADGKIVLGGSFSFLGGQALPYLGRLNPDGSLDASFSPNPSEEVNCAAVQPDGKILIGGIFATVRGQPRVGLARLNQDGTLDGFNPGISQDIDTPYVNALLLQPDGKILVGGSFTGLAGQPCANIGRLNPDGSLDVPFNPGASGVVYSVALQADGKILVGGSFYSLAGQYRQGLCRLNSDGSLDSPFNPLPTGYFSYNVFTLATQPDGRILVGGNFDRLNGVPRGSIGRLNSDGSLDTSFNPGANSTVSCLALQTDGKILVGGSFYILAGQPRISCGRLNSDGSADSTFFPSTSGGSGSLAIQADGKVLVAASLSTAGGQSIRNFARLSATDPATKTLSSDGTTISWLRGGSSPEAWRTTFEVSTNGLDWTGLGAGMRIAGGWQLSGLSLSANSTIRARGFASGGFRGGSSWFVENTLALAQVPPIILSADGLFGLRSSRFGFNTHALSGQAVVIEASTNLVAWVPVQTNLVTDSGLFFFADQETSKFARRFYHARLFTGTLPPPAFLSGGPGFGFQDGRFGFSLGGVLGQSVVIEASTNLQAWTPLVTNTLSATPFYFTDPGSTNFAWRFYRLRVK